MSIQPRTKHFTDGLSPAEKLEEARNRYGRAFKCDVQVKTLEEQRWEIVDAGRAVPVWLRKVVLGGKT